MRWSTMAFTVVTIAALALVGCGGTDEETEGGTGGEIASLAGHPAMEAETHKKPKGHKSHPHTATTTTGGSKPA